MNTTETEGTIQPPALVYNGATLYDKLTEHALHEGTQGENRTSPNERMEMLSRHVCNRDFGLLETEALYEVAIWTILHGNGEDFEARSCAEMLASAASRGHKAARFVIAKACADRACWAVGELHRCASDGNPYELARTWLRELSEEGYADARVEWASDLWERGRTAEANSLLSSVADAYPEALARLGLHQLATETDVGIRLLDKGEAADAGRTLVKDLEDALDRI